MADDVISSVTDALNSDEDPSTLVKVIAPVAALGATWLVRKVLDSGYKAVTGKNPPHASDPTQPMVRIIVWAATTAAAIAVVNVVIDRVSAPREHHV